MRLSIIGLLLVGSVTPTQAQTLQTVSICYVEDGRLATAPADYDPASGFATMTYRGEQVEVHYAAYAGTHVGGPYAEGTAWYTEGADIEWHGQRYERDGLPRVLSPTDVVSVGTYEGVPLFAEGLGEEAPEVLYVPVRMHCELQPYRLPAPAEEANATPEESEPDDPAPPDLASLLVQHALAEPAFAAFEAGDYGAAYARALPLAEAGNVPAQFLVGAQLFDGLGVEADEAGAVPWLRASAEGGFPKAQWYLGEMHAGGQGVAVDTVASRRWLRLAAEGGLASAQLSLGLQLFRDTPEHHAEAARWLDAAARQGAAAAMGPLASLLTGLDEGIEPDFVMAYAWSHLAAELDPVQGGTTLRFTLEAIVTPRQRAEAEKVVADLKAGWGLDP